MTFTNSVDLADCSQDFTTCNTEFLNRMNAKCNDKYKPGIGRKICLKLAKFYHSTVSGKKGAETFTKMTQKFCDCTCDDPNLTTCQDQCVDTRTDPKNCGSCNFNVSLLFRAICCSHHLASEIERRWFPTSVACRLSTEPKTHPVNPLSARSHPPFL